METIGERIDGTEVLLRRIPPSTDLVISTCSRGDGTLRATSPRMSTRPEEDHLSCSRLRLTSPRHLLDDLQNESIPLEGWHVCQFLVSDVRELGLSIAFTPTDRDPGHCSITDKNGLAYPKNKAQKLARRTRILTDEEIDSLLQQ